MVDAEVYGAIYRSIHPTRYGTIKGTKYCLSVYDRSGTIIMIFTVPALPDRLPRWIVCIAALFALPDCSTVRLAGLTFAYGP